MKKGKIVCDGTHSGPVLFRGGAHTQRITLLERKPHMHCCRLHLRFAFGLLTTLLNPVEPDSGPS